MAEMKMISYVYVGIYVSIELCSSLWLTLELQSCTEISFREHKNKNVHQVPKSNRQWPNICQEEFVLKLKMRTYSYTHTSDYGTS